MTRLAITSMYANPLHPDISSVLISLEHADELWVIINNDNQAEMKRWVKSFQDEQFRMSIVWSLKPVHRVFLSVDQDGSVCESLRILISEAKMSGKYEEIIFTKWWDRFASEIPEAILLRNEGVRIVDWLWAKTHNSSDLVNKLKNKSDEKNSWKIEELPKNLTEGHYLEIGNRPWEFIMFLRIVLYKVKTHSEPWKRLSLQSHTKRSEHWTVVSGVATVDIRDPDFKEVEQIRMLRPNEWCHIPVYHLHRLSNTGTEPLVIVEVQCGEYTGEDDITRYDDDFGRK